MTENTPKQYIYVVTDGDKERLIRAKNGPAAKVFAAAEITYRLASQTDLEKAFGAGAKVEETHQ